MKTLCLPLPSLSPYVPDFVDSALFSWHHQSSLTSIIFLSPSLSHTCPLRRILLTPRGVSQWRLAISTFSPQKCLSMSLYINTYLLPEEASLMKNGQGTSIWVWQSFLVSPSSEFVHTCHQKIYENIHQSLHICKSVCFPLFLETKGTQINITNKKETKPVAL